LIGIVIVAHGGLATEYKAAVEHVVGAQRGITAVAISADCNREAKRIEICQAADGVDMGGGVVIVTDMFGGSPSNLSLSCLQLRQSPSALRRQSAVAGQTCQVSQSNRARSDFAGHRRGPEIHGLPP
jgi:mannose/fructose-specific phosphotransferase system component IIA